MVSVLFIGNSHTYYHEMPQMLVRLAEAGNPHSTIAVEQSTASGVSLEWHWRNQPTRDLIARGDWDAVVLQERSGGPLEDEEAMHEYARRFHEEISEWGAETVFYMTWARTYQPGTQPEIATAYTEIADELNATLAPVGAAWKRALERDSDLRLHAPDGRHADPPGSYLAACVFYALFCDADPTGLSGKISVEGKTVVDLPNDRASFLQTVAHETVKEYGS
jgi:hypothetical protein